MGRGMINDVGKDELVKKDDNDDERWGRDDERDID